MEQRPKARVRAVPIFSKLDKMQLHRIVSAAVSATFRGGDTIVSQGDMGDTMYIIERGRCDVLVGDTVVHKYSDGDSFGELSLLSDEARSASVVATSGEVVCMVLPASTIRPILEECWGKGELDRRERTLRRVPIFGPLARGELRRLSTQLERVEFPDTGFAIISEGEAGEDMYVISQGNCEAFTNEHGRVKEYGPGELQLQLVHSLLLLVRFIRASWLDHAISHADHRMSAGACRRLFRRAGCDGWIHRAPKSYCPHSASDSRQKEGSRMPAPGQEGRSADSDGRDRLHPRCDEQLRG
jgi:CRP-like cAMP-binding protein